jgi:hypothetical protein
MKLSIVGIVYDVVVCQIIGSVLLTLVLLSSSFKCTAAVSGVMSVIAMGSFALIEWAVVSMLLVTMDMLILPPVLAMLHYTWGIPYA